MGQGHTRLGDIHVPEHVYEKGAVVEAGLAVDLGLEAGGNGCRFRKVQRDGKKEGDQEARDG